MSDHRRLARGITLGCWAAFFAWLHLSGEKARYLGPRTYWVVVFGAVVLGAAALGHLLPSRRVVSRRLEGRDLTAIAALLAPLLAVAAVPSAELGALAASRKSAGAGAAAVGAIAPPAPESGEPLTFVDVHYASRSETYAAEAGVTEGMEMKLTGFVTHPRGLPEGTLGLTRFQVSCCAADAVPYTVPVVTDPGAWSDDTWLEVTGRVARLGGVYVLDPVATEVVDAPSDPYLY